MGSNQYGERVTDAAKASAILAEWDFTKPHLCLSVSNHSDWLPDVEDIEGLGELISGDRAKQGTINQNVAVVWFGCAGYGLLVDDQYDTHFLIPLRDLGAVNLILSQGTFKRIIHNERRLF